MTKKIYLSGEVGLGKFAIVDDEDYDYLSQYNWLYNLGYARHKRIYMHRMILNAPKGVFVDHKNLDKLDNRRDNLRLCNSCGNVSNRKKRIGPYSSMYKGVCFDKRVGKWKAEIKAHLGYFCSEVEAAKAYNNAAIINYGEFARLNEFE